MLLLFLGFFLAKKKIAIFYFLLSNFGLPRILTFILYGRPKGCEMDVYFGLARVWAPMPFTQKKVRVVDKSPLLSTWFTDFFFVGFYFSTFVGECM